MAATPAPVVPDESIVATPLDDYVNAEDTAFFYEPAEATVTKKSGYTAYSYHMTSQGWLESTKVDRTTKPSKVLLWQAVNPEARDFRQEEVGNIWKSTSLTDDGAGNYRVAPEGPEKGWTAFFVEFELPTPELRSMRPQNYG